MFRALPALVPLVCLVAALAGCVAESGDRHTPAASEAPAHAAADDPGAEVDGGWTAFDAVPPPTVFEIEGAFDVTESWMPLGLVKGLAGQPPGNFAVHDISDHVPPGVALWVEIRLAYEGDDGSLGAWLNGPNHIFWIYDTEGQGNGMTARALVSRTAEEAIGVGVWYGDPEPAPTAAYTVHVMVHGDAETFHPGVAYGVTLGRGERLEVDFSAEPDPQCLWTWDADDVFLGTGDANGTRLERTVTPGTKAGEFALFVPEGNPTFRLRVFDAEGGLIDAPVRILTQSIVNSDPTIATPGATTTLDAEVPVQPLQVGYGFFTAFTAVDAELRFFGPGGAIHDQVVPDPNGPGVGGFHNTGMGVPMMPPGTYALEYTDTYSHEMNLQVWYVTYAR